MANDTTTMDSVSIESIYKDEKNYGALNATTINDDTIFMVAHKPDKSQVYISKAIKFNDLKNSINSQLSTTIRESQTAAMNASTAVQNIGNTYVALNKQSQTITGAVTVNGNLSVKGTLTSTKAATAKPADSAFITYGDYKKIIEQEKTPETDNTTSRELLFGMPAGTYANAALQGKQEISTKGNAKALNQSQYDIQTSLDLRNSAIVNKIIMLPLPINKQLSDYKELVFKFVSETGCSWAKSTDMKNHITTGGI